MAIFPLVKVLENYLILFEANLTLLVIFALVVGNDQFDC